VLDPSFPKPQPEQVNAGAPAHAAPESALWADFGPDFYAAVSWSDVPKRDGRRLWLGWMSNGTYAKDVPTSPWRSAMSIPRELTLRQTADGIRLQQKPAREMEKLRDGRHHFKGGTIAEANTWLKVNSISGDSLELIFELASAPESKANQGIKLLTGAREATLIGVDREAGRVYVDRTQSGTVTFHPKFSSVHSAPLAAGASRVRLHIFVDACSLEVFVNDGERVLTDLVLPAADSHGLEFFGPPEGAKISALDVWPLKSSW
jgi:fructan beta-fructosidase